ncbi:MAG: glutamate--tRNA ligase, partial [Muribaculaceae bacterium]|nr:glutamate--tRNA ligase [Muribaculaceae bacterium]
DEYSSKAVGMVKGRITFVKDLWDQASFFFVAPETFSEKDIKKRWKPETPAIMEELIGVLQGIEDFTSKPSEEIVLKWITDNGYHMGNVMNAFRLTVVGECRGPHMFDITELMGKEATIERIRRGTEIIKGITDAQ